MSANSQVEADLRAQFRSSGVRGWLHARPVDPSDLEVALDAEDPVVMASVYKLPVLVSFARAVDAGTIDPLEPVLLDPQRRTPGQTGIAAALDPVTMSWRDLARSMITVSDNAAGDALLDRIGLLGVRAVLDDLGLVNTHLRGGTRDTYATITRRSGAHSWDQTLERLSNNDVPTLAAIHDPVLLSSTTARDMTSLIAAVWTDDAASNEQCEFMRSVLSQQIWPHRLASGFTYRGVRTAGKTGTLGPLRHEVGVVEHQNEPPIAIAVLTRAARSDMRLPIVDATIGSTARYAVTDLRQRVDLRQ